MAATPSPRAVLLLLALPLIFPAVLAMGATIGPDILVEGGPVSINLTNVTDSTSVNTSLTTTFSPAPGVSLLNFTGWVYPFSLTGGRMMVEGQNVNQIIFVVRSDGVTRTGRETGAGRVSVGIPLDILPAARYDYFISYEVHDPGDPLKFTLVQQGIKNGTERNAFLHPNVTGIGEGDLAVRILGNGALVAEKDIPVRGALPPSTTLPVNTTETGTMIPTTVPPETAIPTTGPSVSTPAPSVPTPEETIPAGTIATPTPLPARPSPPPTTPVPPPETPAGGPSPFIIGYAAIIVLVTVVADYMLLKD